MSATLTRRLAAEFLGTLFLLAAVVGSGIMAERLAAGDTALALLANTIATGAALIALILALGPISGAHLNPAVSLAESLSGALPWREAPAYIAAQLAGAFAGVAAAHLMFGTPIFSLSVHMRSGPAQAFSEFVATFGLLAVIFGCTRLHREETGAPPTRSLGGINPCTAFAVGAYITSAYWFTASTSFANPAVTLARALTNTFSGIRPIDVPAFIAAQLAGALSATLLFRWLLPPNR